jgi:hypothetical protein
MTQTIKFSTHERSWKLDRYLKNLGYEKTADCYWVIVYEHPVIGSKVVLERE